jgi:hypothetical protein
MGPSRSPQSFAVAAPVQGDDLGRDGRGLLGGPGAEVEADGGGEAGELGLGQARLVEALEPVVVGASRSHRTDVAHVGEPQGHLEQGT